MRWLDKATRENFSRVQKRALNLARAAAPQSPCEKLVGKTSIAGHAPEHNAKPERKLRYATASQTVCSVTCADCKVSMV